MLDKIKTHLSVDCHPYSYAHYVFCTGELRDDFEDFKLSSELDDVTCDECKRVDKELQKMIDDDEITLGD